MLDLNIRELKILKWIYFHKLQLWHGVRIVLILINILIYLIFILKLVTYIVETPKHNAIVQAISSQVIDFTAYNNSHPRQDLDIINVSVIKRKQGRYDFVAKVSNSNKEWGVPSLRYSFETMGFATESAISSIAAQETKAFTIYNVAFSSSSSDALTANFKIQDIAWNRNTFRKNIPKIEFSVENISNSIITPPSPNNTDNETKTALFTNIKAEITNQSIYSFWSVPITALIFSNDEIIGVKTLSINEWKSQEKKFFSINWSFPIQNISSIELYPDVSPYNASNLMKPQGGTTQPL